MNVKFLIEGEEEVGSANLDSFIKGAQRSPEGRRRGDLDSPMFAPGIPSISYGLRRIAYSPRPARLRSDLHSGSFGGGVTNPAMVLAQVLSQMKDKSGRVRIDGFYDDVVELQQEERNEWARLPFNEKKMHG